jgi:hypothetical protein
MKWCTVVSYSIETSIVACRDVPHVRPHPVIAPLPPGLLAFGARVPGEVFAPLGVLVRRTTAKSLGVKPEP